MNGEEQTTDDDQDSQILEQLRSLYGTFCRKVESPSHTVFRESPWLFLQGSFQQLSGFLVIIKEAVSDPREAAGQRSGGLHS